MTHISHLTNIPAVFDYGFKNAGNDTITDFTLGNTATRSNADIINLSDLLIGYSATYILVKGSCSIKHSRYVVHLTNTPIANVLVKDDCVIKHIRYISYLANIPTTQTTPMPPPDNI
jgi:hypothetical protein